MARSPAPPRADRHLVQRVPTCAAGDRAGAVRRALEGRAFDAVDFVYVLDEEGRLSGMVALRELLAADESAAMETLARPPPPDLNAPLGAEAVASLALAHRLTAVPRVDVNGRLVGVIPGEALLEILRREHVDDLHRLAGMSAERRELALPSEAPTRRVRERLPWLLVGLTGSIGAAAVVSGFGAVLQGELAVAYFVPALVYLADAVGTQTETLSIRSLSHFRPRLGKLLATELWTGWLLGLVFAAVLALVVRLFFGGWLLALAVAIAVATSSAFAAALGVLLPWVLARAGQDPALGSGPLATVIQDLLTLVIYLVCATVLLA